MSLLAIALWSGAVAQEPDCREPVTQMEMNICAGEDFRRADAELNRAYAAAMAAARAADADIPDHDNRGPSTRALRDAQRAWVTFRDRHCTFQGFSEARGGSMEPMVIEACRATLTQERTRQLRTEAGQ